MWMRKKHPSPLPKASAKCVNEVILYVPFLLEFLTDCGLVNELN